MRMKTRLLVVALAAAFLTLAPARAEDPESRKEETYELLDLFGDVFERVRSDYVEEPTDRELIEAAITGMLTSLDPHSSYLDKKSFQEMRVQTRGEFGGLGIEVTMENGLVKVVSPIDDTPAFRAGIEPGDLISHLDGKPVMGLTLSEAVDRMRGKVNTDIKLTIRREGRKPFDVTITRAVIKIRSVRHRLEDKVGYIRITQFNEQAESGLKKAMKNFREKVGDELQGIVLDLRNNPGGLLDQAIKVSDAFLERGEIVSTRARDPNDASRFNAAKGDVADGLPMVVLINGGSASASEIVAGALQDHRRALIMGSKSFGKGSVQTIIPLPGRVAMRLTTSRYYTPSGTSIQAKGIVPDVEVRQAKIEDIDASSQRREADLRGALDNGDNGDKGEADDDAAAKPDDDGENGENGEDKKETKKKKAHDYQLERALDLLRGLYLFSDAVGAKK